MSWILTPLLVGAAAAVVLPLRSTRSPEAVVPMIRARVARIAAVAAAQGPRRLVVGAVAVCSFLALLVGGTVAAVVAVVYAWLAARTVSRRSAGRREAASRARMLDDLAALAADLRAGLPRVAAEPTVPVAARTGHISHIGYASHIERPGSRVEAVLLLADRTGAPAAELVERLEADARAIGRAAATATAQAAGVQATAMLLAVLPLGGMALGMWIGAHPVQVLLHTPIGGVCAIASSVLQAAGILWTERIARVAPR